VSDAPATVEWEEGGVRQVARWRSEAAVPPPHRLQPADDTLSADAAYRLACEGTALVWRGDFQNARQLLQALARRVERPRRGKAETPAKARPIEFSTQAATPAQAFHLHRQAQGRRARILGMLLVPLDAGYGIPLRRAPALRQAVEEAWGPPGDAGNLVSLRELLGLVGAHEWRKKGVEISVLGPPPQNRIQPHYGVFSPVRGEYLELIAKLPLPSMALAFEIGTGTGVIAALLARRGVQQVVATDQDPRALACAQENIVRLGLVDAVQVVCADMFAPGRAPLVVCNPPWLPARASSPVERAIYDEDSCMLRGFLGGLVEHLSLGGEGWLVLSDIAEHLGLRTRAELLGWIEAAGLVVRGRVDIRPRHPKAHDASDPLAAARSRELTSVWRLVAAVG